MLNLFMVGLLAVAAALVSLGRRTAGRPPLWRSKLAFSGAVVCLALVVMMGAYDPAALLDTPLLVVAAVCLYEGGVALIAMMAASGRPAPRWLA